MNKLFLLILTAVTFLSFILPARSGFDLTDAEADTLARGELVMRKKKIEGAPWPEITVFSVIKASPDESMGIFYAYHEHRDFLPDLLYSIPSKYITPLDLHIRFEMKIPWPLRNSRYTTGNKLSRYEKGGYRIDWYHVSSTSSKTTRGVVIFKPFNKRTMFIYRTFVHPKSKLAGMFKKKMAREVRRSVNAIRSRIESIRNERPGSLPAYINALERSFRGEYIYKNIPAPEEVNQTHSD